MSPAHPCKGQQITVAKGLGFRVWGLGIYKPPAYAFSTSITTQGFAFPRVYAAPVLFQLEGKQRLSGEITRKKSKHPKPKTRQRQQAAPGLKLKLAATPPPPKKNKKIKQIPTRPEVGTPNSATRPLKLQIPAVSTLGSNVGALIIGTRFGVYYTIIL